MGAFTMPSTVFNLPPAGGQDCAADYAMVPAAGATLTVNWTADRLVSFRGYFKDVTTGGVKTGFQSFVNNNGGSWLITAAFNGADEWIFGVDSVTATGVLTLTVNASNGRPYAVVWDASAGKFVAVHRASDGKFCSVYFWNGTAWRLLHS